MTETLTRSARVESAIMERRTAIRDARQLLVSGLELISAPERWTQLTYARDGEGRKITPGSRQPPPAAWCLLGCIWEAEYRFVLPVYLAQQGRVPVRTSGHR